MTASGKIFIALFPILFLATLAVAQTQQGPFKHIIIIVQENRTPDNLFGSHPAGTKCIPQPDPFEPGVDIVDGGNANINGVDVPYCSISLPLDGWDQSLKNGQGATVDPDHTYEGFGADYTTTLTSGTGYMDGFCHGWDSASVGCPPYSYVQKSDVQPYFDIATAYGFANYMFQSSEGPSMPAHQFLFTGTSAPVAPGNPPYSQYFVGDNVQNSEQTFPAGCAYTGGSGGDWWPQWVYPDGSENPGNTECYTHDSLVTAAADCNQGDTGDSCDRGIDSLPSIMAWAYYAEPSAGGAASIWDAPAFIPEVCYGQSAQWGSNKPCGLGPYGSSTEWSDHVRYPLGPVPYNLSQTYTYAPVLDDILACKLPAVSWVIPDGDYSDHPPNEGNATSIAIGPSWVGDIIDTVGQSYQASNNMCDYWGYPTRQGVTPEPTAIFVVWDDWGGWFDHIRPWIARIDKSKTPPGYTFCDPSTHWGCGYTDGFRVPLLVVSPYTPAGYISGECGVTGYPLCGDSKYQPSQYVHDFGSILAYTEWNFGMPPINLNSPGYADSNAPDNQNGNTPLSDFFPLPVGQGRSFTYINTPDNDQCFQYHTGTTCALAGSWAPTEPDSY